MTNLKLPLMTYESITKLMVAGNRKIAYATTVARTADGSLEISHHGNPIAYISPRAVKVSNAGYDTPTTAHRLDRILTDNGTGARCRIRNFSAEIVTPEKDTAPLMAGVWDTLAVH